MKVKDFLKLEDLENYYLEKRIRLRTKSIAHPEDDRYSVENFEKDIELSPIECEIEKA